VAGRPQGSVPPFLRAQRMRYQGLRAADAGDVRGGDELRARAVETLEGLGYPYWTACAQLDRAGVLESRGDLDGATQLRDAALVTLCSLGAGHVLAEGADHLGLTATGSPAPAG
jgi:hypothetical protein